jgi:hypothetical protein
MMLELGRIVFALTATIALIALSYFTLKFLAAL